MSSSDHKAHQIAHGAVGAIQELAKQGGANVGNPHGVGQVGQMLVTGAAAVAPVAVAKAGALTAATLAAGTAAAAAAAPFVLVGAAGYGVYRLVKALDEDKK
jgi:hypothetical protein